MEIYSKLPEVLNNRLFSYLSHPCADMIRNRVEQLKLDSVISIEGILQNLDLEFDMRDLFVSEYFITLKCDRQRRLWRYKLLSAENIIQSLLNKDRTTSEEEYTSSAE